MKEQVANRLEEQLVDGWEQPKEEEEDLGITDSHELKVLPDNEDEEKEEILLADTKTKRSKKQPETKTSQQKNEKEEPNNPFNGCMKAIGGTSHSNQ